MVKLMSKEKKEGKVKTTIYVSKDLWADFQVFVIKKFGSKRKLSEVVEEALKEYIKKHSKP